MPNGIRIRSAILPQCTGQADRPTDRRTYVLTDRPTDRRRESLTTIGRCATRATRPNNKKKLISYFSASLSPYSASTRCCFVTVSFLVTTPDTSCPPLQLYCFQLLFLTVGKKILKDILAHCGPRADRIGLMRFTAVLHKRDFSFIRFSFV